MKTLTASDRSALIRLASTLPRGTAERKAILAGLRKVSSAPEARDWRVGPATSGEMLDQSGYTGDTYAWSGSVSGSPIQMTIDIGPQGKGDLSIRFSGMKWKTRKLHNLRSLQSLAKITVDTMEANDITPGGLELRGERIYDISR